MMQRVCVSCDDPLNQLSRIVDILRRMDAVLSSLNLHQVGHDTYEATIDYAFKNTARAETFLARLDLVTGVVVLESRCLVQLAVPDQPAQYATG